ncbi:hypothetical protein DYB32_000978 [Aphanomyces invadans]|uniref:Asn/Gln amidotransferase domain-containing protein n=1 Tax=Aphanomyces invadans TaxID=157072 RepID=A0A3R7AF73_9STRA|nr:hypothetical protein DYB32_000978 [Aphanomyces invadans]
MPGTLPSVNKACVAQAVRTAHALQSDVNLQSVFERKHYFYCDLPLGYQITQQRAPIASNGVLKFHVKHSSNDVAARNTNFSSRKEKNAAQKQLAEVEEGIERQVRINRIQIEQDSGKSLHTLDATHVDLNRAGTGLMEIVFEPDLRSAAEAGQVLREVQHLLRHIGTCDGNMEDGSMRCDLNVSVRPKSDVEAPFGERVEVKNMNSIRHLMRAVEYEMERQKRMRSKEGAKDYRFFPEPDLPPLVISPAFVADAKASLPELPDQMKARLVQQYGLTAYESSVLVCRCHLIDEKLSSWMCVCVAWQVLTPHAVEFFEQVAQGRPHKLAANWVLNELFSLLKGATIEEVVRCDLIQHMYYEDTTARPLDIVERHGWKLITDDDALRQYCQAIVSNPKHAKNVAAFQKGKSQLFGFFVGQVMKETEGRAHPEKVNAILRSLLAP